MPDENRIDLPSRRVQLMGDGLRVMYTPDWIRMKSDGKVGYVVDMRFKEGQWGVEEHRLAAYPMLPEDEYEQNQDDADMFLIGAGLKALGEEMMNTVPQDKRERWED